MSTEAQLSSADARPERHESASPALRVGPASSHSPAASREHDAELARLLATLTLDSDLAATLEPVLASATASPSRERSPERALGRPAAPAAPLPARGVALVPATDRAEQLAALATAGWVVARADER
ncbi:MAG: hypothetical protein HY908_05380, partial [Myxococcales bacterium]|nr:hypothetical protein [Myxococcales bacterium]